MAARRSLLSLALSLVVMTALPAAASAGSYRTIPGDSERVGSGTTYSFLLLIDRSVKIDRRRVARQIEQTLFDRRGWTRSGRVAFRRVSSGGNTRAILARPREVDRLCYPLETNRTYSCNVGRDVVLNLRRWRKAVGHWPRSVRSYRRMLVNHEFGHRIGHGHSSCPGSGKRAPVMQQQSISLQGCRANAWPKRRELRTTAAASTAGGRSLEHVARWLG